MQDPLQMNSWFNWDFLPQKILVAVEFLLSYRMLCLIFKQ